MTPKQVNQVVLVVLFVLLIAFAYSKGCASRVAGRNTERELMMAYADGANDALETMSLLAIEDSLSGTQRTWNEAFETVCRRLNVPQRSYAPRVMAPSPTPELAPVSNAMEAWQL